MLDSDVFNNRFKESLANLERELEQQRSEDFPNVFVLGLPRSGTTLLTQILYSNTNLYCTNNLIARFWDAPLVGAYLSKLTIGSEKSSNYESYYGRTSDIGDPHEFSWFWHDLLKVENVSDYDPPTANQQIDWNKVRSKLINLNAILGGGVVHKPLELVGYHLSRFAEILSRAIFVYIERDLMDVAYSIAQARKRNNEDMKSWWGSYPPSGVCEGLKREPYAVQIIEQILFFKEMYNSQLSKLTPVRLVKTSYTEICNDPIGLLRSVQECALQVGCEISVSDPPRKFDVGEKQKDQSICDSLRDAFEAAAPNFLK